MSEKLLIDTADIFQAALAMKSIKFPSAQSPAHGRNLGCDVNLWCIDNSHYR